MNQQYDHNSAKCYMKQLRPAAFEDLKNWSKPAFARLHKPCKLLVDRDHLFSTSSSENTGNNRTVTHHDLRNF